MPGPTRADTFRVTCSIAGINFGVWDVLEGGSVTSEETKYKPGGMQPAVSLGGSRSTENVTLRRLFRTDRDLGQLSRLIEWVGRAKVVVSQVPLDLDGNPVGSASIAYSGVLLSMTPPNVDSQSNDPALIEIVVSVEGDPNV